MVVKVPKRLATRRFTDFKEGPAMYKLGRNKFMQLAHDAEAVYKIDRRCVVDMDILDEYLESFRIRN